MKLTWREYIAESGREIVSACLAVLLLIPALIIRLIDRLTLRMIQKRGGLD